MKNALLSAVVLCALAGVAVIAANKAIDSKSNARANPRAAAVAPDKTSGTPSTKPATQPTTKPAGPINKFCAVDRENPVDPTVPTVVYKGKIIGFCCDDCPAKFKKNPEEYMKDLK